MPRILLFAGIALLILLVGIYFQQRARLQDLKKILHERDSRIFELERELAEMRRKGGH